MENQNEEDKFLPHYSVRPPKSVRTARSRKRKIDNLIDLERDLFDLTISQFAPVEPSQDIKRKPVRRVHIFEHHDDQIDRIHNISNAAQNLGDGERIRTSHLNINADVHAELRASEHRLQLVRRGVPLTKVLENERHTKYEEFSPEKRYDGVNDAMKKMPSKYSGIPPSRKIQFIYPTSSKQKDRVDLVSKINIAGPQKNKLKKIKNGTARIQLQYHNEMIQHLNHVNERRIRSTRQFYDDIADYGYDVAKRKAKRAAQRSRLRVMCKAEWWEDFMQEVSKNKKTSSSNNEMIITYAEEKFIERLARHPNFTLSEFIDIVHEMDVREAKLKVKDRCRQWLDWINERCEIIDKMTLKLMLDERKNIISKIRSEV